MDEQTFKDRTKQFGLGVIRLFESLPKTRTTDVIGRQLLHSATSVGANYRAACWGRSASDVLSKLGIVEEGDESIYWLELLAESGNLTTDGVAPLLKEANETVAMTVASIKTLRSRNKTPKSRGPLPQQRDGQSPNPKSKVQNQLCLYIKPSFLLLSKV